MNAVVTKVQICYNEQVVFDAPPLTTLYMVADTKIAEKPKNTVFVLIVKWI